MNNIEIEEISDGYELIDDNTLLGSASNIYGIENESTRSKICKEVLKLYKSSDNFQNQKKTKFIVWLMIIILLSNPVIGGYTLYYFHNSRICNGKYSHVNKLESFYATSMNGTIDNMNESTYPIKQVIIDKDVFLICRNIKNYAFYEIFGELIFGLFSLLMLCACKLPCNTRDTVKYLVPTLAILYMVIYKVLASYILITSIKLISTYLLINIPKIGEIIPNFLIYLLKFNVDTKSNILQIFYNVDHLGHKLAIIFSLQNIYITISDTIELIYALYKLIVQVTHKAVSKIKKEQDIQYYTLLPNGNNSTNIFGNCSFILPNIQIDDPNENYIHNLYNYTHNVGTYLNNIDLSKYKEGINNFSKNISGKGLFTESSYSGILND